MSVACATFLREDPCMEYTPYFDTLRKTRLLRGMTDAELTLLTESLARGCAGTIKANCC